MEILGLNRGKIKVIIEGKSLIITGELTTTPIFYADINSIKKWEYPHNEIIINDEERENIIKQIQEKTKDAVVKIIFD